MTRVGWWWLLCSLPATALGAQGGSGARDFTDTLVLSGQPLIAHHYTPAATPQCPSIVLLSGDGGWELGVVHWAEALRTEGHEVVGIDAARLVRLSGAGGLARVIETWPTLRRLAAVPPVVLGYSRGATIGLALATRASLPPPAVLLGVDLEDQFNGPAVPAGLGPAVWRRGHYVVDLRPLFRDRSRTVRVAIVHGMLDRVAPYDSLRPWLDDLPEPKMVTILPRSGHGFGDSRAVLPAIRASIAWAAGEACRPSSESEARQ